MTAIFDKTIDVCRDHQWMAATCSFAAMRNLALQNFDLAKDYQREAAYHHSEMAMRLDRIIGVA